MDSIVYFASAVEERQAFKLITVVIESWIRHPARSSLFGQEAEWRLYLPFPAVTSRDLDRQSDDALFAGLAVHPDDSSLVLGSQSFFG